MAAINSKDAARKGPTGGGVSGSKAGAASGGNSSGGASGAGVGAGGAGNSGGVTDTSKSVFGNIGKKPAALPQIPDVDHSTPAVAQDLTPISEAPTRKPIRSALGSMGQSAGITGYAGVFIP